MRTMHFIGLLLCCDASKYCLSISASPVVSAIAVGKLVSWNNREKWTNNDDDDDYDIKELFKNKRFKYAMEIDMPSRYIHIFFIAHSYVFSFFFKISNKQHIIFKWSLINFYVKTTYLLDRFLIHLDANLSFDRKNLMICYKYMFRANADIVHFHYSKCKHIARSTVYSKCICIVLI